MNLPFDADDNPIIDNAAAKLHRADNVRSVGKGLCFRCEHGQVTRRDRDFDFRAYCHQLGQVVPLDIRECSKFRNHGTLTIWELMKIAEVIDVNSKKPVGFGKTE